MLIASQIAIGCKIIVQFEKDMVSEHAEQFVQARSFLLKCDGIVETKKPRITTYSDAYGGICHLRTMPHGIDFGFLKGAKMRDDMGLLTGNGKAVRVLSLRTFDLPIVEYYLRQAFSLNRA